MRQLSQSGSCGQRRGCHGRWSHGDGPTSLEGLTAFVINDVVPALDRRPRAGGTLVRSGGGATRSGTQRPLMQPVASQVSEPGCRCRPTLYQAGHIRLARANICRHLLRHALASLDRAGPRRCSTEGSRRLSHRTEADGCEIGGEEADACTLLKRAPSGRSWAVSPLAVWTPLASGRTTSPASCSSDPNS